MKMKNTLFALLLGLVFLLGGNFDSVSSPLIGHEDIIQVGDPVATVYADATNFTIDNHFKNPVKADQSGFVYSFTDKTFGVILYTYTAVRNKSSGLYDYNNYDYNNLKLKVNIVESNIAWIDANHVTIALNYRIEPWRTIISNYSDQLRLYAQKIHRQPRDGLSQGTLNVMG